MLKLLLCAGDDRYALDANEVVEVAPMVELRTVPHAPAYVAGLLNYRGAMAPVIDLCSLTQDHGCRSRLSTRIILMSYAASTGSPQILGLLAERVTGTVRVEESDLTASNIHVNDAPYLGDVFQSDDGETVQCLHVERLLPESLRRSLFPERAGEA